MNEATFSHLRTLVEQAIRPVRAGTFLKQNMQEELLAHMTAVFEEEAVRLGDEQAALQRTVQRFGDPTELTDQIQGSISASGYVGWLKDHLWFLITERGMVNHQRLYNILLFTLGLYILSGLGLLVFILGMAPADRPRMIVPQWSLPILAIINGLYLLAMTLTLAARLTRPLIGKRLTKAMNWMFLLSPPFGTVLGIYGFWKVDRQREVSVANS